MNPLEEFKEKFRQAAGIIMPDVVVEGAKVHYKKLCPITKEDYILTITLEEYNRIQRGEHVQNVLPHLTPLERDVIITGFTPAETEDIFKDTKE